MSLSQYIFIYFLFGLLFAYYLFFSRPQDLIVDVVRRLSKNDLKELTDNEIKITLFIVITIFWFPFALVEIFERSQ